MFVRAKPIVDYWILIIKLRLYKDSKGAWKAPK